MKNTNRILIEDHFVSLCEAKVLLLSSEGLTVLQISDKLCCSPRTVNRHRENIRLKYNLVGFHAFTQFAVKNMSELKKWVKLPI
ncbi:helix-turn-helix transcriptional regulator [Spirosoma lituiforme]